VNPLETKHQQTILRLTETPSNSTIPAKNRGYRAEWMAGIHKCPGNRPKVRLWVAHPDCTSCTNSVPAPHSQQRIISENNRLRGDVEDVINTREGAGNCLVVYIIRYPLAI
jgi:hypothetical protein